MLSHKGAMRKLDRVESNLRALRQRMIRSDEPFYWQVGRISQVAIDRAVSKRIRLSTSWWKEPVIQAKFVFHNDE